MPASCHGRPRRSRVHAREPFVHWVVTFRAKEIPMPSPPPRPLLTVRAAVVLLIALVVGLAAAGLGYLAYRDVPGAVLLGGGAAGSAVALFHGLVGADRGSEDE